MPKPDLNEDQYIAEMNKRLRQHEHFHEGMAFVPYPEGAAGRSISGYTVVGSARLIWAYAQVAHQVGQKFELAR